VNRLEQLQATGVSIWLDTLSRDLLEEGEFERLQQELAVTGATSNPTIFSKAIVGSDRYDKQLVSLLEAGVTDPHEHFLELALEDVRGAAKTLEYAHRKSGGSDGFVSLEVTPDLAYDTAATVAQARDLWQQLDAPNVMIKVPATEAGLPAIEELTAAGVNVNVTLLFSVGRYEQVIEAYLRGLERRVQAGQPIAGIRSVASFFVSRVDAKADARLSADSPFKGRVGTANALTAYDTYRDAFAGDRWQRLRDLGATPQRPLWASTAPKDSSYRDVLYLESLALPGSILTGADPGRIRGPRGAATCGRDFRDGRRRSTRDHGRARAGGVDAFCAAYRELLGSIKERAQALRADAGRLPALSR